MPAYTDARIRQHCTEALAAKTQSDIDRILPELRSALEEQINLVKDAMETQIIAAMNTVPPQRHA
jgi:hypothetical protein